MTDTPPQPSGNGSSSGDLPASRPSGKTLLMILLVIAAIFAVPGLVVIIVWSTVR